MPLEERVLEAKTNDNTLNDLLNEYKPFIQKVVYTTCQRFVEWGRDEELSVGLLAFQEAIRRYEPTKGNFLSLARTIIRSRVIDYLRKENKHQHLDIDDVKEDFITEAINPLTEEIKELQVYLSKYNISFQDLPNISPVKRELRDDLKRVARIIAKEEQFIKPIVEKKQLPVNAVAKEAGVSYKKLERNRAYLITMFLIWYLDLPLLQGYIK